MIAKWPLRLRTEFAPGLARSVDGDLYCALVGGDLRRTGRQRYRQREPLTCNNLHA